MIRLVWRVDDMRSAVFLRQLRWRLEDETLSPEEIEALHEKLAVGSTYELSMMGAEGTLTLLAAKEAYDALFCDECGGRLDEGDHMVQLDADDFRCYPDGIVPIRGGWWREHYRF
jgi:hypothetical protein